MNPSTSGAPGKNYLLVTGILLVIFSVYSLFGIIPALILSLASLSLGMVGVILLLATLVASASVIINFIAGIMGIINREKPEKAFSPRFAAWFCPFSTRLGHPKTRRLLSNPAISRESICPLTGWFAASRAEQTGGTFPAFGYSGACRARSLCTPINRV